MDKREGLLRLLGAYAGSRVVPEHSFKEFLGDVGLPVPRTRYVPVGGNLPDLTALKFPLVAKVFSPQIRSKSDVGGIRLGLGDPAAVEQAVAELMAIDFVEGVVVEEQAPAGTEVIVGGIVDPQFGPVVMFGLGGIFTELFHDVAFALAPLTREDAFRLMARVQGNRLLTGYRGNPPCDREAAADILVVVSQLMATGLLEEIDLNPVALYAEGAMILDAKLFASETGKR